MTGGEKTENKTKRVEKQEGVWMDKLASEGGSFLGI